MGDSVSTMGRMIRASKGLPPTRPPRPSDDSGTSATPTRQGEFTSTAAPVPPLPPPRTAQDEHRDNVRRMAVAAVQRAADVDPPWALVMRQTADRWKPWHGTIVHGVGILEGSWSAWTEAGLYRVMLRAVARYAASHGVKSIVITVERR